MKSILVEGAKNQRVGLKEKPGLLASYVVNPIKSGLVGFTAFFSILVVTKLFSYLIGTYEEFVIDIDDVFERCLTVHEVPPEQRPDLITTYHEAVSSLYEDDGKAE